MAHHIAPITPDLRARLEMLLKAARPEPAAPTPAVSAAA